MYRIRVHNQSLGEPGVFEDAQNTTPHYQWEKSKASGFRVRSGSITAIPDEILCDILIKGYTSSVTPIQVHGEKHEQDPTKYLLAISQTCNWFRNISLSCTLLWVRVHLEWPLRRRQLWVRRSGTRELEVHMHSPKSTLMTEISYTPGDVFDKFYEWPTLCLCDVSPDWIERVLRTVVSAGPAVQRRSLQSINITRGNSFFPHLLSEVLSGDSPISEGGSFQNLREITLSHAPYDLLGIVDHVVTLDVRLHYVSWNHWKQLLQQAKALEVLRLDALRLDADEDAFPTRGVGAHEDASPVTLDRLRSLEFREGDVMLVDAFLRDVTAPNLDNISIWVPSNYGHFRDPSRRTAPQPISNFVSSSRASPLQSHSQ